MTRIDFYLLQGDWRIDRLNLVCKLAEKAIGRNQKVFIYSQDIDELSALDTSLWDFRAMSFVAHQLIEPGRLLSSSDSDPVQLSSGEPGMDRKLLINLAPEVPSFFSRFERTLEIVNEDPAIQMPGRNRYRFYKQRGYPLQHHKM